MRVTQIQIKKWRNFRDIDIQLTDNAPLVCLVGANGTGKSHVLELISACAHRIGLSPGVNIPRGDPFSDEDRDFRIEFYLAHDVSQAVEEFLIAEDTSHSWDRKIVVDGSTQELIAGGFSDSSTAFEMAHHITQRLRDSKEIHHLTLDADRAFPRRDLQTHELAQAFEMQWDDQNWTKSRAFQSTRTLYDEWIKFCLAKENKHANSFYQAARRAVESGTSQPDFSDAFGSYRASLREVMPHLLFAGADQERKAILFDSSGLELRFDQLSGGEREIAFLVGQIDRFGLRRGVFLLDEPELHLNPDLVRTWVAYLASTVLTGQVWLATHSLEAVEAAGIHATVLLERDAESKLVNTTSRLDQQPVLSSLSRAVGTPAFSISSLRFVLIEGEEEIGERERYRRITAFDEDTRFIESGPCSEVLRRIKSLKQLAQESNQDIRIVGIIDRDWRTAGEIQRLENDSDIITLPVHEIENFFLDPTTLNELASRLGREDFDANSSLISASDHRAGGWIIQKALSNRDARDISQLPGAAKTSAYQLQWGNIESDIDAAMGRIADLADFDDERKTLLKQKLVSSARRYSSIRNSNELWKFCEGKEILKVVARDLGFADFQSAENAISALWISDERSLPEELLTFRTRLARMNV